MGDQVDNMLHRTPYPVLLRSTAPTGPERPFLTLDAKEDLGDAAADGVAIIKSLVVGLADTELCLEVSALSLSIKPWKRDERVVSCIHSENIVARSSLRCPQ